VGGEAGRKAKVLGEFDLATETVYIGRKPAMNYVLAVIRSFTAADVEKVVLKARGMAIKTAVDVAEMASRRFLGNVTVDKIDIGSEDISVKESNRTKTVSTIEITLTRSG